jgi:hypothetical protein
MTKSITGLGIILAACAGCGFNTSTVIRTDEAARSKIVSSGVTLPASATNLYYAFQPQFADYLDTWISFSATPSDCMSVAQAIASTKTNTPVFAVGTKSKDANVAGGPAYHHPEYASPRWDLSTVTNGTMFETTGLFVLVDTDKDRVYVSLRAP